MQRGAGKKQNRERGEVGGMNLLTYPESWQIGRNVLFLCTEEDAGWCFGLLPCVRKQKR